MPSPYLQIEHSPEQIEMLNPTARDVQMGAIIDQCSGQKATKKIARRRLEFMEGNINSYARILNGPKQLERIKTFTDLSASVAVLKREGEEKEAEGKKEKKRQEEEKAQRRKQKLQMEEEERVRLAPACKEAVDKGLEHVLSQKNDVRKQILKIHFGVKGVYKMKLDETEKELRGLMLETSAGNAVNESTAPAPAPSQPRAESDELPVALADC